MGFCFVIQGWGGFEIRSVLAGIRRSGGAREPQSFREAWKIKQPFQVHRAADKILFLISK